MPVPRARSASGQDRQPEADIAPDELPPAIGRVIEALRGARGLSRLALARRLLTSEIARPDTKYLTGVEAGKHDVRVTYVARVAAILGVSLSDLIRMAETGKLEVTLGKAEDTGGP